MTQFVEEFCRMDHGPDWTLPQAESMKRPTTLLDSLGSTSIVYDFVEGQKPVVYRA